VKESGPAQRRAVYTMLWAITSYFNPSRSKTRLINYRTFKEHLRAPLVTVELSFDGRFDLHSDDANILMRICCGEVLWQKERLLNLALRALPEECDAVAWLDCDVVFAKSEWAQNTQTALTQLPFVQLFSERCNLTQGATRHGSDWAPVEVAAPGAAYAIATGKPVALQVPGSYLVGGATTGLAWAARRSLLDRHGLYDAHILGAGDRAMVCAAIGKFEDWVNATAANKVQERHYRTWGEPFFADVAAQIGFIEGRIFHLWHGDTKHRRKPHMEFSKFEFDPFNDLAVDASGAWRWSSHKPEMHRFVSDYLMGRREDGQTERHGQ